MADYSVTAALSADRSPLRRRRSKNPLRSMMQHLTVDSAEFGGAGGVGVGGGAGGAGGDGVLTRRQSIMRRLSGRSSRRSSRSPSAHSDAAAAAAASRSNSRPASALGTNADPALCEPCGSLAAEIEETLEEVDAIFTRAANPGTADDFEKREYFLARLRDLEDNRWAATCPLCRLFWAVRVPSFEHGEYCLLGMSSRDTSYLVDSHKMYELEHPARAKARGVSPGFLAVVSKTRVPGARNPDVNPDSFRNSAMLFRTRPQSRRDRRDPVSGLPSSSSSPSLSPSLSPSPSPSPLRGLPSDDGSWTRKGIWGREIGRSVDPSVGLEWLRFCETHHQGRCGRRPVETELQGFRLIDCAQSPPKVVERSLKDDYLALSYVRGETKGDQGSKWPRVVRDAVALTKDLGFRYLWVDIICIIDNNDSRPEEEVRTRHIERMDEIFHGAVITIIAASGDDAMHGLPGVGTSTRPAQPKYSFTTSDMTLVSSLQDPRLLVKSSTWFTRGWTYQEGLCARRRLIFTNEQMYWECDGMACPETMDLPLEFYHDAEEERMCDFVRPGLFNGVSYLDGSWEQWKKLPRKLEEATSTLSIFREADQHIANYTRRTLTHDKDSLSAFLGVSRHLESTLGKGTLSNLVGIPIWAAAPSARTRHLFALSTSFWHHKDGVEARRRTHLPSWTWAGWAGAVDLFSSVVIATDANYTFKGRKVLNHHYVTATQLTRNEALSVQWTYSPEMAVLSDDDSFIYDFTTTTTTITSTGPPVFPPGRYKLRVSNPLVLDRVKARTHPGGWMFNNLSVDVKISGRSGGTDTLSPEGQPDMSSIREYIGRHGRGEQMTILWFVEEAMVMLLVVEKKISKVGVATWERIGRMRMAFPEDGKDVMKACGRLEGLLERLPLRRLGGDIIIE